MSNEITILNQKVRLGETVQINMDIARLHTYSKIEIPVHVSRGKKKGPCLLLTGGIHGNEVNGIEIVRQIVVQGLHKPESGTVICIPLLNVFGFLNEEREFPDGRDLNRVFPGSPTGSLASRFAYHVMKEIVPHADYGIDYHTGGGQRFNYPQLRINGTDEETLSLAKTFGVPYILFAKNREKTFREAMVKKGKKVLLFEGGKSLNLDQAVTQAGVQGAIQVMHQLKMRDFSTQVKQGTPPIIIKESRWIRARYSGMYRPYIQAGDRVEKNVILGSISDPYGNFEFKIKNKQKGHILNSNHSPIVHQGDALIHIGFE